MAEKKGRKPLPKLNNDPDDQWNAEVRAAENFQPALQQCERIVQAIADAPDDLPDSAGSFFADVEEKVKSVQKTIRETGRVSAKQESALDNWETAVSRWTNRGE